MPIKKRIRPEYDLPTALRFLLSGIALGAVAILLFCLITDNTDVNRSSVLKPPAPVLSGI